MRRSTTRMHAHFSSVADFEDDSVIDFKNAALYVLGLQVIVAVVSCSVISILACSLLPSTVVSAVRTLVLTVLTGACCVAKPLRVGRVHGMALIFSSLRPAVAVYISSLVLAQLVHGCAGGGEPPFWRGWVFSFVSIIQIFAGFMRAHAPLSDTDLPFLVVILSLLVVAIIPPGAVALAGPLCSPPGLWDAGERIVRAVGFSSTYTVFCYVSAPPTAASTDIVVCFMRASAASIWTLGAALPFLVLAIPQCVAAIFFRLRIAEDEEPLIRQQQPPPINSTKRYAALATTSPGAVDLVEYNGSDGSIEGQESVSPPPVSNTHNGVPNGFGPLHFRNVAAPVSKARMAEIAQNLDEV